MEITLESLSQSVQDLNARLTRAIADGDAKLDQSVQQLSGKINHLEAITIKNIQELRSTVGSLQEGLLRHTHEDLIKSVQEMRNTLGGLQTAILRNNPLAPARDHQMSKSIIQPIRARIAEVRLDGDAALTIHETKIYTLSATICSHCDCPQGCRETLTYSWSTMPIVPEGGGTSAAGILVVKQDKLRPWRAAVIGERAGAADLVGRISVSCGAHQDGSLPHISEETSLRIAIS